MKRTILNTLRAIETDKRVSVVLAAESGSRAWGFESADSDWDVRFIYCGRPRDYLTVRPRRDVIENGDLTVDNSLLDFSGWDLRKSLDLLLRSNPGLFEWLQSPIVYYESELGRRLRSFAPDYFQPIAAMHHYLSMCRHNYREHMRDGNAAEVKLKKYLYICRPLLCGRFIERNYVLGNFVAPPMRFQELVETDPCLYPDVSNALLSLAARKRAGEELQTGPAVPCLNAWIDGELVRVAEAAAKMKPREINREKLDDFFYAATSYSG